MTSCQSFGCRVAHASLLFPAIMAQPTVYVPREELCVFWEGDVMPPPPQVPPMRGKITFGKMERVKRAPKRILARFTLGALPRKEPIKFSFHAAQRATRLEIL
jgi:hypothetical protein